MIEELKEILEFDFETQGERIEINEYERNKIKDYITNLQQENKQLKETINKVKEYCKREIGNIIANYDYVDTKDLENILEILGDKENE